MPLVSVLMPVYKTDPQLLKIAIDSILNQTFSDFEFLILDDCPEDTRQSVISNYSDSRIKYFINKKRLYIGGSRNKLMDLSSGKYLCIFDSDDYSHSTRLKKQVAFLNQHPDYGLVSSNNHMIVNNKLENIRLPMTDKKIKELFSLNIMGICHPACMIRKSVITDYNIRYDSKYYPAEDFLFVKQISDHSKCFNIQEFLHTYRIHGKNSSIIDKYGEVKNEK